MTTDQHNWSSFSLRVNINRKMPPVYRSWTTQQGLEEWFLREAVFSDREGRKRDAGETVQKGDTYLWRWHGYPDEVTETGTVLEADGTGLFSFTFSLKCPVTIHVYTEMDETIVELTESELPVDDNTRATHFVGDSRGWIFYLTNLKSVLEGGIDLRNKKIELKNVITA